MGNSK
jgi:hypothetical protein